MSRSRLAISLALLIAAAVAGSVCHAAMLRAVGNTLVAADTLRPVDMIVVAADAFEAGALEAADLVEQHIAPRVAVFTIGPPDLPAEEAADRPAKISRTDRMVSFLEGRGVAVVRIPPPVSGTTESVPVLIDWARANQVRSVLFVTTADHSRRLHQVVARARAGTTITLLVRPTRYSNFEPDNWWRSDTGVRTFGKEFPKLVADAVLHPWSYVF